MTELIAFLIGAGVGTLVTLYIAHSPWRTEFGNRLDFYQVPSDVQVPPTELEGESWADWERRLQLVSRLEELRDRREVS